MKKIQQFNREKIIMSLVDYKTYAEVPCVDIYKLTLDQVLRAIGDFRASYGGDKMVVESESMQLFWWDLEKPTLEEQDEDMQRKLADILGIKSQIALRETASK